MHLLQPFLARWRGATHFASGKMTLYGAIATIHVSYAAEAFMFSPFLFAHNYAIRLLGLGVS